MAPFSKQLLQNPSGFPDIGPAEAIALERMLTIIRAHFERAGYAPLKTPLVERPEILLAKAGGEINNQIYGLRLLNPAAGAETDEKDLALRFDHTIPLARYVATHGREIPFPFRRSAIGSVFRGEHAKDGRYREFIQADIDAVGDETLSPLHDAEMVKVLSDIFTELAIGSFTVRINNRKVLKGLLAHAGVGEATEAKALRVIDRLEKVGRGEVVAALEEMGVAHLQAQKLIELLAERRSTEETLSLLEKSELASHNAEGAKELREVIEGVRNFGVPEKNFTIDLSIARGLDYYTGTVFETRLDEHTDLGSIASGGRYAHLASAYVDHEYPGVGVSIGVTRLLMRLIKAGLVEAKVMTPAQILITTVEGAHKKYFAYAGQLRAVGIPCELYLADKALDKQLAFADRRGYSFALIARAEDLAKGHVIIRNLKAGTQEEIEETRLVEKARASINPL